VAALCSAPSLPGGRLLFGGRLLIDAACWAHASSSLIRSSTSLRIFGASGLLGALSRSTRNRL